MAANAGREPGKAVVFTVNGVSNDWASAALTTFTVDMIYPTTTLAYRIGSVRSLMAGVTVTDPNQITVDPTTSIMRFTVNSATPIATNGNLFEFSTTLLLSNELSSKEELAVNLGQPCLLAETFGDSVKLENCALTQRVVGLSTVKFSLAPIHPNPSTGGSVAVDFGVGINAPTTIDLVNTQGQVVRTFVNSQLQSGEYTLSFPTTGISNGAYVLRMRSADFNKTVSLIVAD